LWTGKTNLRHEILKGEGERGNNGRGGREREEREGRQGKEIVN
jgi:hypothetical protein